MDEEARQEEDSTTGVCMEYFLKNGVLQYLVSVAEKADYPVGIRGETIRMIANMVDLLDDRFLVHNAVHRPTIRLLRFCVLDERQSELYHEDLVDLMYTICSKIHGFPALLNIFFHDKQQEDRREYEFLLFTYLLRFVHREGRSGDYARTGLLFVMEMASSDPLAEFILSSDFAIIMAAGLGALYSQLPRKLVVTDDSEAASSAAAYLLGQDFDTKSWLRGSLNLGAEESDSPGFRYQLDAFLKLLEFCQDVLLRCPNDGICSALLRCIRAIFLENILYPSILECSDVDGSSVAVISYIDLILQTVEQDALAEMIVGFLFNEDDDDQDANGKQGIILNDKNGKLCSNLFAGLELDRFKSSPYFTATGRFTLKDLIFSRLKSSLQPPVIATLKLLRTLLTKHCRYSLKLLSIQPDYEERLDFNTTTDGADKDSYRAGTTISHHIREIDLYFSLISAIDQVHAKETQLYGYQNYLSDVEALIECDECYQSMNLGPVLEHEVAVHNGVNGTCTQGRPRARRRRSFKYGDRLSKRHEASNTYTSSSDSKKISFKHQIRPTDPLLQTLLGLLSNFFAQSAELNLALTGVISALAMCPYRSLKGWIAFRDSDRTSPDDVLVLGGGDQNNDDKRSIRTADIYHSRDALLRRAAANYDEDDDDLSVDFGVETNSSIMTAPTHFKSFPPFFTLFRTLTQQVDYYRSEIDNFDTYLDERRTALQRPVSQLFNSTISPPTSVSPVSSGGAVSTLSAAAGYIFGFGYSSNHASRRPSVVTQSATPSNDSWWSSSNRSNDSLSSSSSSNNNNEPSVFSLINDSLSPLAVHARKTQTIRIQPLFPSNFTNHYDGDSVLSLDEGDEDAFAPVSEHPSIQARKKRGANSEITLSMLLNNVVILEEAIKELIAVMQVRSSLGIDRVCFA